MLDALENVGASLVDANSGEAETQKLFDSGSIVDAIEKLRKVFKDGKMTKEQKEAMRHVL